MPIASYLYECQIAHARTKPRSHSFLHRHFMMYLDLDEVEQLQSATRLFSTNGLSLYRFLPADHLPDILPSSSLQGRVRNFVRQGGVEEEIGSIRLLTNVRVLGYVFNPVSFFFCFDRKGRAICCLVEVGNTFGEKKAYLVRSGSVAVDGGTNAEGDSDSDSEIEVFRDRQQKLFYVSPFTDLGQDLDFDLALPSDMLAIRVDTMDGDDKVVATSVKGKRLPFTDAQLVNLTLRYPWAPLRVIALIHLHALLLWLKRIPHHRKEENIKDQVDVLNPHFSLRHNWRR